MKKTYSNYTVSELCRVLKLSSSSFYYKKVNRRSDIQLRHQIRVISSESNHTYGKRRIREELVDKGSQ
ncbi:hypothetical protein MACH09_46350 [Vibrio sp. MACH09]|nr:hypothetical protein MACH09_46350 [Vibrio sp. MACH09]